MPTFDEPFVMAIAAPRKSGKSYFIKKMWESGLFDHFDHIIVLCPSIPFNDDYYKYSERDNVTLLSTFSRKDIETVFQMQSKAQTLVKGQERGEEFSNEPVYCPETLLILDDCIDSGVASFHGVVDKIAERGRHIKLSCIVSAQRLSSISRGIRTNSDYFVTFSPFSVSELEQFLEQFITKSITAKKDLRKKIVEIYKKPFEFLFIDNTEKDITKKLQTSNADDFIQGKTRMIEVVLDDI